MANRRISSTLFSLIFTLLLETLSELSDDFFGLFHEAVRHHDGCPSLLGNIEPVVGRVEKGLHHEGDLRLRTCLGDTVSLKSMLDDSCLYIMIHRGTSSFII